MRLAYADPRQLGFGQAIAAELAAGPVELRVERERRFAIHDAEGLLSGSFDRLVLLVRGGRVLAADLIDFKTDRPAGAAQLAAQVEFYRPQIAAYRRAIARLYRLDPARISSRLAFLRAGRGESGLVTPGDARSHRWSDADQSNGFTPPTWRLPAAAGLPAVGDVGYSLYPDRFSVSAGAGRCRFLLVVAGLAASFVLVWVALNFHVFRTQDRLVLAVKRQPTLADLYVDVRGWSWDQWSEFPDLAWSIVQSGNAEIVRRTRPLQTAQNEIEVEVSR